mgnify:CR=1 FL=1
MLGLSATAVRPTSILYLAGPLVHIYIAHTMAAMRSVVFVGSVSALAPWGSHFNYLNLMDLL